MRILQIEDDPVVVKSVELLLSQAGYELDSTDLGGEGTALAMRYDYDLIILDIGLPDTSGHQVLRELRSGNVDTPVLVLSGRTEIEDKVGSLTSGADDYLAKPFDKKELIARIEAVVRRAKIDRHDIIKVGDLTLDPDTKKVEIKGRRVSFTGKEYEIVELLARRKGATLARDMLLHQLYGGINEPQPRILDVYMAKIRKKLADVDSGRNYIHTIWGRGYSMREPGGDTTAVAAGEA